MSKPIKAKVSAPVAIVPAVIKDGLNPVTELKKAQLNHAKASAALLKLRGETPREFYGPADTIAAGIKVGESLRNGNMRIAATVAAAVKGFEKPEQAKTEAGRVLSALSALAGLSASEGGTDNSLVKKSKVSGGKFAQGLTLSDLARQYADSGHKTLSALSLSAALAAAIRRNDSAASSVAKWEAAVIEAQTESAAPVAAIASQAVAA